MKQDSTALRPLPGVQAPQSSVRLQAAAGQRQYQTVSDPSGGTTAALLAGLAALNPRLAQLRDQSMQAEADKAREAGRAAGATMDLAGATSETLPARIAEHEAPLAFGDAYKSALSDMAAERFAIKSKQDMVAAYNDRRMEEGFDPEAFAKEWWQTQYSGLKDPRMVNAVSRHHEETLSAIRQDQEKLRNKRLDDIAVSSTQQLLQDRLRPSMTAEELSETYRREVLPMVSQLGRFTKAEAATMLAQRVAAISEGMGGAPELYDALDKIKDDEGFTVLARNPQLSSAITGGRAKAEADRAKRFEQSTEDVRAHNLVALNRRLETDPASITDESILGDDLTFKSPEQKAAFLARRDEAVAKLGEMRVYDQAAEAGILGTFPEDIQRKTMERKLAPYAEGLRQGIAKAKTDPAAAQQLPLLVATVAQQMANAHRLAGSTVASLPVKGMMSMAVRNPVKPGEQPSPEFIAAAELYRHMDPQMRQAYVPDEDGQRVYEAYLDATQMAGAADPAAAAAAAFETISPEAKRRAKEVRESPEFKERFKDLGNQVAGNRSSIFLPRFVEKWAGLVPQNADVIGLEGRRYAESFLERNPTATVDQAVEYAQRRVSSEWVMDKTTSVAVKVPPQINPEKFAEAVSAYTAKIAEGARLGDRNDGKWTVVPHATNAATGSYILMLHRDGMPIRPTGTQVTATDILRSHQEATLLNEQDRAAIAGLQNALKSDTPLSAEDIKAADAAVAKARALGLMPGDQLRKLEAQRAKLRQDRVNSTLALPVPDPSPTNLIDQRPVKVDRQATSKVTESFLAHPGWMGIAGALVTQGEAVALTAYTDPNPAAGKNIGTGYNLNANAATVNDDLRRAGVPKERIEDVKSGRASLTPEQAENLTKVVLPRYAKQAKAVVDKADPALWDRLTDPQRAVMVDLAWQLGQGSLEKFKKAVGALAAGDNAAFLEHSRVFYTNAKGERVEDTRRNNLRAHAIRGTLAQAAGITKTLPSTPVDIIASN